MPLPWCLPQMCLVLLNTDPCVSTQQHQSLPMLLLLAVVDVELCPVLLWEQERGWALWLQMDCARHSHHLVWLM